MPMLYQLSIQNFAIIDDLVLDFQPGTTTLTGETGAGKSILVDALLLALGERAESTMIRHGEVRCVVQAEFVIESLSQVQTWLIDHGFESGARCFLRRMVNRNGRSQGFINDQMVSLQVLREFGRKLIHIHGQHTQQTLLHAEKRRLFLDTYGENHGLVQELERLYEAWCDIEQCHLQIQSTTLQKDAQVSLLQYQLTELEHLSVLPGECTELEQELRQLTNAQKALVASEEALSLINDAEPNGLQLIYAACQKLERVMTDKSLQGVISCLNTAAIQLEEAGSQLTQYTRNIECSPERLQVVEQRLSKIYSLAHKHRIKPNELTALQQQIALKLQEYQQVETRITELLLKRAQIIKEYQHVAQKLTHKRQQIAAQLQERVTKVLQQLNMPEAQFSIVLNQVASEQPTSFGHEQIEFYVSTHRGQPLGLLAKIASGGELSRIYLAIQMLTAQALTTPVLIFDEVDVGIGGSTAAVVGHLLRQLGRSAQVLCVTHLPQVAVYGHQHLRISKINQSQGVSTQVDALYGTHRVQEIARMLGGIHITSQTVAHAKEMLESALKTDTEFPQAR
jgi:DNA repair protein RecN (Recombination protein N)